MNTNLSVSRKRQRSSEDVVELEQDREGQQAKRRRTEGHISAFFG